MPFMNVPKILEQSAAELQLCLKTSGTMSADCSTLLYHCSNSLKSSWSLFTSTNVQIQLIHSYLPDISPLYGQFAYSFRDFFRFPPYLFLPSSATFFLSYIGRTCTNFLNVQSGNCVHRSRSSRQTLLRRIELRTCDGYLRTRSR
jgi:hypothetical protein